MERSLRLPWGWMLLDLGDAPVWDVELTSTPERTGTLRSKSTCRPLPAVGKPTPSSSFIFSRVAGGTEGRARVSESSPPSSPPPPQSDNFSLVPTLPSSSLRRHTSQIPPEAGWCASIPVLSTQRRPDSKVTNTASTGTRGMVSTSLQPGSWPPSLSLAITRASTVPSSPSPLFPTRPPPLTPQYDNSDPFPSDQITSKRHS